MKRSVSSSLAILGIGCGALVLAMIWAIVNTALASIQKDLGATILQLQWMMNAFGIFLCVPLLTMGKLGDSYGRKRIFLVGLFGLLIASVVAGFAEDIHLLIACMALFGLSGSIILPLSQALIVHQYPERQKEKAIAVWAIFVSISCAIGPLVGGVILNFFGWRWAYFINIPLVCTVIPLVYFFVAKDKKGEKPHCDWLGVGLLALTVCSLIVPIMQGPSWGWTSAEVLGLFAVSIIAMTTFIRLEKKAATPLFRPDLFLQRSFLCSSIANGCTLGFIWVAFFMIPLYLQNMRNFTPLEAGLTLVLATLPVALLSVWVSKQYAKIGPKPLLFSGFSLLLLSSFLQVAFVDGEAFWPVLASCACLGLGWVFVWGPSISSALSSLPHNLAGMASGMFTTLQELGAVLSLSIAGVIFRMTRNSHLEPHMNQINQALHNFTPDRKESFLSDPSAVQLAVEPTSPIIPWVREAFLSAYHDAFLFVIALCLIALIATFLMPSPKQTSTKSSQDR